MVENVVEPPCVRKKGSALEKSFLPAILIPGNTVQTMQLYNTLTKQKEPFTPIHKGKVSMYTCGPTVYGKIHIGNIRAYLLADILRRALTEEGFEVRHIKNITDVGHLTRDDLSQGDSGEDKVEQKAREERVTPQEITERYEQYFRETEEAMNILPAHLFPRATKHISQMIKLIETLIEKGHAYERNGNVFLDVTSFDTYGNLSGNTLEKLQAGARIEPHPDKRNDWDFALWLAAKPDHVMRWESPWSVGYPGWHIECSAMSMAYLGESFDIHTGGEDNIFPHHEAEIAQSECATGHRFVRYWVHGRHLLFDGVKMSKSKGNLYTLEDIEARGFSAMDLRLALLSSHYRSQMNFTWKAMEQAKKNRHTITKAVHALEAYEESASPEDPTPFDAKPFATKFSAAVADDLNTPLALSIVYELFSEAQTVMETQTLSPEDARGILANWEKMNEILGLHIPPRTEADPLPEDVQRLLAERQDAREKKDYAASDRLRDEIAALGYTVEDTATGQQAKKY